MKRILALLMAPLLSTALLSIDDRGIGATPDTRPDPVPMVAGMTFVPSGDFIMGSNVEELRHIAEVDEWPQRTVWLDDYYIDVHEVTNAQYKVYLDSTRAPAPHRWLNGNYGIGEDGLPVVSISWDEAAAYAAFVGKRLPTEAEWEKAARGVDGRRYPWGSRFEPDRVNAGYTAGTAAAGSYAGGASPYGVLDMAGSVWEWTSSLYRPYPYDPGDGREDPAARGARVNRGGSWYYGAWYVRTTHRATADHMYRRIADLGFRCAKAMPDRKTGAQRRTS